MYSGGMDAPSSVPMTTAMIDGVAVHTAGDGPAIVLLHANGGSHRDFDAVVGHMAQGHLVHAVDWPGHGDSDPVADPTAREFAALLTDLLGALPGGPFLLVGNSVGGFAAIDAAAARPDLVRGLILVSPGGFTPRWPMTVAACRAIASGPVTPRAMRLLPRLYLRRRNEHVAAILDRARLGAQDPAAIATYASLWRSFTDPLHDAGVPAASIAAPTLLAWGRQDPVLLWHLDGRRARAAFPDATVASFACGHQPFAELPEQFLAKMEEFERRRGLVAP
jgi:pimeloyl-ACP methyl ester carboxylesterase